MPRNYKKVTNRDFSGDVMKRAVSAVIQEDLSLRAAATLYNVKKSSLANYVKKTKEFGSENVNFSPNFAHRQIFTKEYETKLVEYLLQCSNMFHGLTPKAVRRLAFEYAHKNSLKMPDTWAINEIAGEDWFSGFMKRNPTLSIRTPEATSLARMTSFNPGNVKIFFDKLEEVISRYGFSSSEIYNLDEVGPSF